MLWKDYDAKNCHNSCCTEQQAARQVLNQIRVKEDGSLEFSYHLDGTYTLQIDNLVLSVVARKWESVPAESWKSG